MSDAPASEPLSPELLLARKRRLTVLLGGIFAFGAVAWAGITLTPSLIDTHPLLLAAMTPSSGHLLNASTLTDAPTFFLIGALRLFIADPLYYLLGLEFGDDAVAWAERRAGPSRRFVRWSARWFEKSGSLLVFLFPYGFMCLMAGSTRMKPSRFVLLNVAGTLVFLSILRWFGVQIAGPLEQLRTWVDAHWQPLTVAIIALSVVFFVVRSRRQDKRGADDDMDLD